jgi:hypothetical protein
VVVVEFVNPEKYTLSLESTATDSKCEKLDKEPVPAGAAFIFHKCAPLVDNLKPTPRPAPRLLMVLSKPVLLLSLIVREFELVFIDTYTPVDDAASATGNSEAQIVSPELPVTATDHCREPALEYFTTNPSAPAVDTSVVADAASFKPLTWYTVYVPVVNNLPPTYIAPVGSTSIANPRDSSPTSTRVAHTTFPAALYFINQGCICPNIVENERNEVPFELLIVNVLFDGPIASTYRSVPDAFIAYIDDAPALS